MPKHVTDQELDEFVEAVERFNDGASIREITSVLSPSLHVRSIQRRLERLVAEDRLTLEGVGRASRYRVTSFSMRETPPAAPRLEPPANSVVQLVFSREGNAIRSAVRAPQTRRQPVGYKRSFLESYRPNKTCYLSPEVRRHLAALGGYPEGGSPAGTHARRIYDRLLIDLSWNSSRLEGNTYSLLETERLLVLGISAVGKEAREAQMILNHKAAIEMLVEQADEIGFNRYTICNLHSLLAENLLADPEACGRTRNINVGISGTVFHPLSGPQAVEEVFHDILAKAHAIDDPFEQSFFAMVHLPYLQPFEDVNKRVSRFAANIPFIRRNLCPISFVDVPATDYIDGILGVYELNRVELLRDVFVWAYERSCGRYAAVRQSLGDPDPFRMRYRTNIKEWVTAVVRGGMDRTAAIPYIRQQAEQNAPAEDRARLVEVVETEILSLHEGNFARFRVRPSEYNAWRVAWQQEETP